jgi:hypothetical protein
MKTGNSRPGGRAIPPSGAVFVRKDRFTTDATLTGCSSMSRSTAMAKHGRENEQAFQELLLRRLNGKLLQLPEKRERHD